MFYQRITHILNTHKNALVGNQPWSELCESPNLLRSLECLANTPLAEYIFGFEPMNEYVFQLSTFFDQDF